MNEVQTVEKKDEISVLTSSLLSTLNESSFFGELSQFLVNNLKRTIRVYIAYDDGNAKMVARDGIGIEGSKEKLAVVGHVVRSRRPYFSNSVKSDPLFVDSKDNPNAELCIPINCEGIVFATINIQSFDDKTFSQDDITEIYTLLGDLERPLNNMGMYLAAKRLNEVLLQKIELNEKEMEKRQGRRVTTGNVAVDENEIIGSSKVFRNLLKSIDKVGVSDSNVLIEGESGTGKEMVAKKIHIGSSRSSSPFVVVNCAALQEGLLESELFGHEKGSFTGAIKSKEGLVEIADGGTLFLDEIGELTPVIQAKLLRFIQEGEAYRVGGSYPYKVKVRVLAATNKNLRKEVEEGRFREDLYYRLSTIKVDVPSLREREEDIRLLAQNFLNRGRRDEEQKAFTPCAIKAFMNYAWPGNIRELQNVVERAYVLADGRFIDETHLPECKNVGSKKSIFNEHEQISLHELEKRYIVSTLKSLKGNKTKSAKALGITVKTLYNKLHSYDMIKAKDALV